MRKNVIVTGGNGLIGQKLCDALSKSYHVFSVDMQHDTPANRNITAVYHDITKSLKINDVAFVFNLASTPSPLHYEKNPIKTAVTNIIGTLNMLNLALNSSAVFIQASTCDVCKNYPMYHKRLCYVHSKKMAEVLCFGFAQKFCLDVRVVRFGNIYGPGFSLNDGRVIPEFVKRALLNDDIIITENVKKSFLHVTAAVNRLIEYAHEKKSVNCIDIASQNYLSIQEIAEIIIEKSCSSSKIVFKDKAIQKPETVKLNEFSIGINTVIESFRRKLCGKNK